MSPSSIIPKRLISQRENQTSPAKQIRQRGIIGIDWDIWFFCWDVEPVADISNLNKPLFLRFLSLMKRSESVGIYQPLWHLWASPSALCIPGWLRLSRLMGLDLKHFRYACTYLYIYIYIYIYLYLNLNLYLNLYLSIYIYIYICKYIYIHIIYIYIYTRQRGLQRFFGHGQGTQGISLALCWQESAPSQCPPSQLHNRALRWQSDSPQGGAPVRNCVQLVYKYYFTRVD